MYYASSFFVTSNKNMKNTFTFFWTQILYLIKGVSLLLILTFAVPIKLIAVYWVLAFVMTIYVINYAETTEGMAVRLSHKQLG